MKHINLAAFGAVTIVAGAFGAHLGQSAIAGINPIHFQGAAVHPRDRGAAVPEMLEAQAASFSDGYGWEQGRAARAEDCGNCDSLAARDAFASGGEPVFAVMETGWSNDPTPAAYSPAPQTDSADEAAAEPDPADQQMAQIDRYSHYPLQAEPESAPQPEPDADQAAPAAHQQMALAQE